MMHGLIALDEKNKLLTPFRTWKNSNTGEARKIMIDAFEYNIPHRWSSAHLLQSVIGKEDYVNNLSYMTTLSGYIHFLLTGEKVLGIGDASGMFPIDYKSKNYNQPMIEKFTNILNKYGLSINIEDLLPSVKVAGESAGYLTPEGAKLLDPNGDLESGIFMAPPEGDAETGMIATNAIKPKTGNISVGTSIFSMIVLERDLQKYYEEIDIVATPNGYPVAMVHANNGMSEFDSWLKIFKEYIADLGLNVEDKDLYEYFYKKTMQADPDCGNLMSYNIQAGEPIIGVELGRPMLIRKEDSRFNLSNLLMSILYSTIATIRIGQDILTVNEGVHIETIVAHGGAFNTKGGMQKITAAGLNVPVDIYSSAGEGGPWGMALLALYAKEFSHTNLPNFLKDNIFQNSEVNTQLPDKELVDGFNIYLERFKDGISVVNEAEVKF